MVARKEQPDDDKKEFLKQLKEGLAKLLGVDGNRPRPERPTINACVSLKNAFVTIGMGIGCLQTKDSDGMDKVYDAIKDRIHAAIDKEDDSGTVTWHDIHRYILLSLRILLEEAEKATVVE